MKTLEEFARDIIPDIDQRYGLYKLCQTPEKLIGLKVVAIRAGFGCGSEGGTKMTITSIGSPYTAKSWSQAKEGTIIQDVHLEANEDTHNTEHTGWMCYLHELPHSVKPY